MKLTVLDGEKQVEIGELTEDAWKSAGIRAGWFDNKGTIAQAEDIEIPELKVPEGLAEGEYPLELRRGL